jgi:hypothetical protein
VFNKSAPGRIRTCDTGFRRAVLYPLSYEGLIGGYLGGGSGSAPGGVCGSLPPLIPVGARGRVVSLLVGSEVAGSWSVVVDHLGVLGGFSDLNAHRLDGPQGIV